MYFNCCCLYGRVYTNAVAKWLVLVAVAVVAVVLTGNMVLMVGGDGCNPYVDCTERSLLNYYSVLNDPY